LSEFQALWYNALKIIEFFSRELNKNRLARKYAAFSEQVEASYNEKFLDKKNSRYYDIIRDNYKDSSFRYHQIFQISLPFPLVQGDAALLLLKRIEDELLTQYGLRSLSSSDSGYIGKTDRFISPNDSEYYSGAVWPWTIGIYTDAVLNVRGNHQQVISYLTKQLENFRQIIYSGTLGYISEIYDGDEPHSRNGAQVYPVILSEYIRAVLTIDYNKS
jgi:glycogen debranching enzyme